MKTIGIIITNAQHKMYFAKLIPQLLKFWKIKFENCQNLVF
jgi:hypothetical protein